MKEDLLKIIKHYGVNHQQRKLQEEVFELNEAIIQAEEFHRFNERYNIFNKQNIKEEIADVLVMLEQFRLYYGIPVGNIKEVMEYKVKRQIERIKNESNRFIK